MRPEKLVVLAAITMMSMPSALAEDQKDDKSHRRGPPPAAIEACSNSTDGQACSFTGRRGREVEGFCVTTPSNLVACRPDKPRKGRRSRHNDQSDTLSES